MTGLKRINPGVWQDAAGGVILFPADLLQSMNQPADDINGEVALAACLDYVREEMPSVDRVVIARGLPGERCCDPDCRCRAARRTGIERGGVR